MDGRRRPGNARLAATLLAAVLVGACSSQPQSQARETTLAPTASPQASAPASASASPAGESPSAPAASPTATARPTAALREPGKPARVTFKEVDRRHVGNGNQRVTYRLTWSAPEGVATSFTVFGVTECLREAKAFDGKPCLVKGMRIPGRVQELLATVPGSARRVDVAWKEGEIGPGPYYAVLIRASNAAGDSIFTIAWSGTVCWGCVY
jgi:hypothetical protein